METKQDIRKIVLRERSALGQEEWMQKSSIIAKKIIEHPLFNACEEVYCYVNYRREVCTKQIIEQAWKLGKKVAVPKVLGSEMEFYYIADWMDLEIGYRDILEPKTKKHANGQNVLVIMPGAVFDRNCNRIGYGKGYYDRYLAKNGACRKMALAFELQMRSEIPCDIHDVRPEAIVTEEKIYV